MKDIEQYKNRFFNLMESTMGNVKPLINEQTQLNQKESFSSFEACFAKDNIKWISSKSSVYKNPNSPVKDAMEMKEGNKRTIIYKGQDNWESGSGKRFDDSNKTQQKVKWVCDSNGKLIITPDGKVGPITFD